MNSHTELKSHWHLMAAGEGNKFAISDVTLTSLWKKPYTTP